MVLFVHHLPELLVTQSPISISIKLRKCLQKAEFKILFPKSDPHLLHLLLGQGLGQLDHLCPGDVAVLVLVI